MRNDHGRFLLAVPMVVHGVMHLISAPAVARVVPAWIPQPLFCTYVVGVALIAGGLAIAITKRARWGGTLLGAMIVSLVLLPPRSCRVSCHGRRYETSSSAISAAGEQRIQRSGPERGGISIRRDAIRHGQPGDDSWTRSLCLRARCPGCHALSLSRLRARHSPDVPDSVFLDSRTRLLGRRDWGCSAGGCCGHPCQEGRGRSRQGWRS